MALIESPTALAPTSEAVPSKFEDAFNVVLGYQRLRINSIDILRRCQILGGRKSQMEIPLCRMIRLQVVRPTLAMDIEKMKADFIHEYHPGAAVFYVSTTNIEGNSRDVTNEDRSAWNFHWRRKDMEFEQFLQSNPELRFLSNKMFYVWDGNLRLVAWMEFISKVHPNDLDWHFCVRTIVLHTLDIITNVLTAMDDINQAIENLHVKTNLVHTLHRMQKVGTLHVEEFKDVLSLDELVAAKNAIESINQKKPWYNILRAKFLEYIHNIRSSCLDLFDFHSWIGCIHNKIPVLISKTLQRLGMRHTGNTRMNTTKRAELPPSFVR